MPAIMMNSLSKTRGYNHPSQLLRRRKRASLKSGSACRSSSESSSPYASDLHLAADAADAAAIGGRQSNHSIYMPILKASGGYVASAGSTIATSSATTATSTVADDAWGQYVNVERH